LLLFNKSVLSIQWAAVAATIISVVLFIYTLTKVSFQWPEAYSATAFHQFAMDSPVAVRFLWQVPTQIIFLTFFIFLQKEKTLTLFIYSSYWIFLRRYSSMVLPPLFAKLKQYDYKIN